MKRHIPYILLLVAGVAAIYAQTAWFDYVRLDDPDYTFECAFVKDGLSTANVREAFSNFRHGGIWMPATYTTYMADISLFGSGAGPHHVVSAAFHAANATLLYWMLVALLRGGMRSADQGGPDAADGSPAPPGIVAFGAFVAAAFWAWHPMRVESVAWVASRKDVVFTLFTLLGLIAWRRGVMQNAVRRMRNEGEKRDHPLSIVHYLLSIVCAAFASMSKPTGMVFAFPALAVELMARREFRARHLWKYIPLLAIGAATGLVAMYSEHFPEEADEAFGNCGSFAWRSLNALVASGLYLWNTILPSGLHIMRWPRIGAIPDFCALGLASLLAGAAAWALLLFRARRRGDAEAARWLTAAGLWAAAAIAPCLGVFASFGHHAWADRFSYLPAMGLSLPIGLGLARAMRGVRHAADGPLALIAALIALAVYGQYSFRLARTFRNDFTVMSRAVKCDSGHPMGLAHMGSELCNRLGNPDAGIECYRRSLASEFSHKTLGQLAFALALRNGPGDHAEVRNLCAELERNPSLDTDKRALAIQAIGIVAFFQKRWEDAIRFNMLALERHPENPDDLRMRLAICCFNAGKMDLAERHFRHVALTASSPEARAYAAQCLQRIFRLRSGGAPGL